MSAIETTSTERKLAERINPDVTGRLAVSDRAGGIAFVSMDQVMTFAKLMAISSVAIPKHLRGNAGACLAIVVQALEWQMSAFAVANKSYSVNDRIAYEAQLIEAVILRRAPIKGRPKIEYKGDGDRRVCRVSAELRDEPGQIVEYTSPPFGHITPKNSPLWKADPDQQHFYYSVRAFCRRHFPDVLLGVYARDELDDSEPIVAAVGVTSPDAVAREDGRERPDGRRRPSVNEMLDDFGAGGEGDDELPTAEDVRGILRNEPEHDEDGVVIESPEKPKPADAKRQTPQQTARQEFLHLVSAAEKHPPKTADTFKTLTHALIDAAKGVAPPHGADRLQAWWTSEVARKLRNGAGMTAEDTNELAKEITNAIEELRR